MKISHLWVWLSLATFLCVIYFVKHLVYTRDSPTAPIYDQTKYIRTSNCMIHGLDADDMARLQISKPLPELNCQIGVHRTVTYVDGSVLRVKHTPNSRYTVCKYNEILRELDNSSKVGKESDTFTEFISLDSETESIKTHCVVHYKGYTEQVTAYHFVVPLKNETEKRCNKLFAKHKKRYKTTETFNVQMLGIEAASTLSMNHLMPKTKAFLNNKLNAYDMSAGHHAVGGNSFPNIVPMTAGLFIDELQPPYHDKQFDDYNFIWKEFSQAGYRTHYAEDSPEIGTFWFLKKGFQDPPTDYYSRPLALAIYEDTEVYERIIGDIGTPCLGDMTWNKIILNYIADFAKTMTNKPHFGFSHISELTHNDPLWLRWGDYEYVEFLQRYEKEGHFNNTIMILFGDHGSNYAYMDRPSSYLRQIEHNLSFLYLIFPKWFNKKYPQLARNLKVNTRRLTSHFDIHETLKDILYFDGTDKPADIKSRGISLLREIPEERSCADAGIPPQFCMCRNMTNIRVNSTEAIAMVDTVMRYINQIILPVRELCADLKLKNVSSIFKVETAENQTQGLPDHYLVTLNTTPGNGLFEATLVYNLESDRHIVRPGSITRLSRYGNQSSCVKDIRFVSFCFCSKGSHSPRNQSIINSPRPRIQHG